MALINYVLENSKDWVRRIPGIKSVLGHIQERRASRISFDFDSLYQQIQIGLLAQYRNSFDAGQVLFPFIKDAGFRCYSQFEEDGILLYVLSGIGIKNRTIVEIGSGNSTENMSTNLILNHGFKGFLFDGSDSNIRVANRLFQSKKDCLLIQPELTKAFLTRDNVNKILKEAGATGEVDVLSIDIDGNDYYIWEALEQIQPRLCVFETHDIIPSDLSLTIPYQEDFNYMAQPKYAQDFRSASLLAMTKLSAAKGYRLIGSHRHGFNVFFLRNDIATNIFSSTPIAEIHNNPWSKYGQRVRWPKVEKMKWVEV